jgi:hypothetical protein
MRHCAYTSDLKLLIKRNITRYNARLRVFNCEPAAGSATPACAHHSKIFAEVLS